MPSRLGLLVIEEFDYMLISLAVVIVTSVILKLNWLDRIQDYPETGLEPATQEIES